MNGIRSREIALVLTVAVAILLPGLWSFTLIDPWEGHYAEVARRILQDGDWIALRWKDQSFRSKPVLGPWLVAASLRLHGLAREGGYSGEMVASSSVIWAVRLPFALSGVAGLTAVWLMVARLARRRTAWLALAVTATMPIYFFIARQAMTDMPMAAAAMGALACYALAVHDGDRKLRPLLWRLSGYHAFLAALIIFVGGQLLYNAHSFHLDPRLGVGVRVGWPAAVATAPFVVALVLLVGLARLLWPVRTSRHLYLLWLFFFLGIGLLAKGPPGVVMVAVICTLHLVVTGHWRRARELSRVRSALVNWLVIALFGVLVVGLVAGPWHLAMALRDGTPWIDQYFGYHWLARAASGAHAVNRPGEGTFVYYLQQLGIGMWPHLAFMPAAVVAALRRSGAHRDRSSREDLRLLALLWAIAGFAVFSLVKTKFHHYILPAAPGFAILVALWLDDQLDRGKKTTMLALAVGVVASALVTRDLVGHQEQLIELFVYRYDRPWPSAAPWSVDLGHHLFGFGVLFAVLGTLAMAPRLRRIALVAALAAAVLFAYYGMNYYMQTAGPHWGQRRLHVVYYRERRIHGVELEYDDVGDLAADWAKSEVEWAVDTYIPKSLDVGAPMTIRVGVGGGAARERRELVGEVSRVGASRLWIRVPADQVARLADLVGRGRERPERRSRRRSRPRSRLDADRLIAWQLFWRGEMFWSGGEIWGDSEDTRTDFPTTDNSGFLAYLGRPDSRGRTFYLITEAQRVDSLRGILPPGARQSLRVLDTSCNKFTLVSFTMPGP